MYDRPRYKPAQLNTCRANNDEMSPVVIAALALAGLTATVALGALWMLCII